MHRSILSARGLLPLALLAATSAVPYARFAAPRTSADESLGARGARGQGVKEDNRAALTAILDGKCMEADTAIHNPLGGVQSAGPGKLEQGGGGK